MNPPTAHNRFDEVKACSRAEQIVAQLSTLNTAPSAKQHKRQREQRQALWDSLARLAAEERLALASEPETPRKRATRAKSPPPQAGRNAEELLNGVNAAETAKLAIQTSV